MRGCLASVVMLVAVAVAGCGGSDHKPAVKNTATAPRKPARVGPKTVLDSHAPVAIRYLRTSDFPGHEGDPRARVFTDPSKFVSQDGPDRGGKGAALLRSFGFKAGVNGALIDRKHSLGIVVVIQFRNQTGAVRELQRSFRAAGNRPPSRGRFVAFHVSGVPGARGWDYLGNGQAAHNVAFADKGFFYLLGVVPGSGVSRSDLTAASVGWYTRVHNHPSI